MKLRDATERDFGVILDLNEESVHFLSPLDLPRLNALHNAAELHLVVERDGEVHGVGHATAYPRRSR